MAEDVDQESKTEEATSKRLDEAHSKGDFAKTPDLPQWATLAAVTMVLVTMGGPMANNLMQGLTPFIAHPDAFELQNDGGIVIMRQALGVALPFVMMVFGTAIAAGVFSNLIQTGFVWTPDKLKPDLSKLNPLNGFKRVFGLDGWVNFGKALLKASVIGVICYNTLAPHQNDLEALATLEPQRMLDFMTDVLKALFESVLGAMGVGAIGDWVWQRYRFAYRMKMSREEVKDEAKQADGDPQVKQKQKQIRIDRARRRMMQNVPKATVVVMNPTHFAVALLYDSKETPAPLCVAKGVDSVALKIREVAEANNVPVIEDPPLARALYATVDIDETIPREHFEAVAKVIGFVLSAGRRRARAHR